MRQACRCISCARIDHACVNTSYDKGGVKIRCIKILQEAHNRVIYFYLAQIVFLLIFKTFSVQKLKFAVFVKWSTHTTAFQKDFKPLTGWSSDQGALQKKYFCEGMYPHYDRAEVQHV